MKINFFSLTPLAVVAALWAVKNTENGKYEKFNSSRFHQLNSSGASSGNTGAPGENNCTGCHTGTVQSGQDFNILSSDGNGSEYVPGQTYVMVLDMADASSKNGFQLVPLKQSDNTAAGTITEIDDVKTQVLIGIGGRNYLGHRAPGNTDNTWSFQWTAPATNVGNVVFYVATNKTNANGFASGDLIRLSQHVFTPVQSGVSLTEYQQVQNSLKLGLKPELSELQIIFTTDKKEDLYLNLVNLQGQSVVAKPLGASYPGTNEKLVKLPQGLSSGIYIVNFFIGNKAYSEKISIQ